MKKQIIRISASLIAMWSVIACQKEDAVPQEAATTATAIVKVNSKSEPPVGKTLGCELEVFGDGLKGTAINLRGNSTQNVAIFSPEGGNTFFSIQGNNGTVVEGIFSGNQPGQTVNNCSMTFTTGSKTYVADNSVQITLEEYSGVGGQIKGNFSGTFRRYDVHPVSGKQLSFPVIISNGKFTVIRGKDLHQE